MFGHKLCFFAHNRLWDLACHQLCLRQPNFGRSKLVHKIAGSALCPCRICEKTLLLLFIDRSCELSLQLVTFNSSSFEFLLLRYWAMVHDVAAP